MTGRQFQECLAHIGCMGREGFIRAWGRESGMYLFGKFYEEYHRDVARFILYLDNGNMNALMAYLNEHLKKVGL